MSEVIAETSPDLFPVPAVIRFDNAAAVRRAGEAFLDGCAGECRFSLAALQESNSVVVALLLAWLRRAHQQNRRIRFADVPADLLNIIDLYGLTELLSLDGGSAGTTVAEPPPNLENA